MEISCRGSYIKHLMASKIHVLNVFFLYFVGFDLDISEDSPSGSEEDTVSVTSWEDMSTLDPNMLLFKAAQARNLPVMLEALANKADPNWISTENEDKTPIMKAIETVSIIQVYKGVSTQANYLQVMLKAWANKADPN